MKRAHAVAVALLVGIVIAAPIIAHGIARSARAKTAAAASAPQSLVDEPERLDSALRAEARKGFSGVVFIARGDSVVFEKAYGRVASMTGRPGDIAFWIASNSKQFTASAILRLFDEGKLRLTDSIPRFFQNVPPDKRGITIHQLLTHTSGLPHEYATDGTQNRDSAIAQTLRLELLSAPGTKYAYSNDGYVLLATIVEIASKTPFDEFLQDSLFRPAGLTRTGVWGAERADVPIAPVLDVRKTQSQMPTIMRGGKSVANWGYRGPTGVYSTARDIARWIHELTAGTILKPGTARLQLGRHVKVRDDSTGQRYVAYGWGTHVEGGRDVTYAHLGNEDWLGHNCVFRFTPEGEVVVVLANSGDFDGSSWSARANSLVRRFMPSPRAK